MTSLALDYSPFLGALRVSVNDPGSMVQAGLEVEGDVGRYAGPDLYLTVGDAVAAIAARRAAVGAAYVTMIGSDTLAGMAAAMAALLDLVLDGGSPSDRLRTMAALAGLPGGGIVAVCCRRLGLSRIARASADYQPTSYEDALRVRVQVCGLLDGEILRAADAGEDGVYAAFRALRAAVSADLQARGGTLPHERTVTVPPMPAAVLAYRLYGDATRADELVARANPVHPSFMPTVLQVLDR